MKDVAKTLGIGYSNMTETAKEINEKILPAIFKQVDIMLSGSKEEENGGETN